VNRFRSSFDWKACALLLWAALVTGCASFDSQPVDVLTSPADIYSHTEHDVTVLTTILSDELAQQ
jgi:hypothetical protein